MNGWIKLHRNMLDNPAVCKDAEHLAVWVFLLLNATHKPYDTMIGGKRVTLQPGQLVTSRKTLSDDLGISQSKVERIINLFKIEQQIEQQSFTTNRVISVLNWHKYQEAEQQSGQQSDSDRTASGQRPDTNNKERSKEQKNGRTEELKNMGDKSPGPTRSTFKPPTLEDVIAYCEERQNNVDAARWIDFYASKGWMIGKSKMKDWKAAVRTWEKGTQTNGNPQRKETSYDVLQRMIREGEPLEQRGRVEVNYDLFS